MPIKLETLDANEKAHIAVKGNTTWAMAAAALKQRNGNASWPLVVKKADGSYVAAKFETIVNAGETPPETLAENLPGLVPVQTLEVSSVGTDVARTQLNDIRGLKVLVLVDQGKFVGALNPGVNRGDNTLPTSKLNQLAGQHVDLSKLGDFLLDE